MITVATVTALRIALFCDSASKQALFSAVRPTPQVPTRTNHDQQLFPSVRFAPERRCKNKTTCFSKTSGLVSQKPDLWFFKTRPLVFEKPDLWFLNKNTVVWSLNTKSHLPSRLHRFNGCLALSKSFRSHSVFDNAIDLALQAAPTHIAFSLVEEL